jgi:hypothetical protein
MHIKLFPKTTSEDVGVYGRINIAMDLEKLGCQGVLDSNSSE